MYRKEYDEKKIMMRAACLVYDCYPEWPKEKKEEEATKEEWLDTARKFMVYVEFINKIVKHENGTSSYENCKRIAKNIIENMPKELWPNIEKWIDEQQISDIKVHGVSIPDIMLQFPEKTLLS